MKLIKNSIFLIVVFISSLAIAADSETVAWAKSAISASAGSDFKGVESLCIL